MKKRTHFATPLSALLVELEKLDLGSKPGEGFAGPCSPGTDRTYYPSIYISDRDSALDLPEKGTATVEYVVKGRSMNERDGKKRHSADLEIRSIDTGSEAKAKAIEGAAVALEDLRAVVGLADARRIIGIPGMAEAVAEELRGRRERLPFATIRRRLLRHLQAPKVTGLSALLSDVIEFGRTERELMKLRRVPFRITKTAEGEFRVAPKLGGAKSAREQADRQAYYTHDVQDARNTAVAMHKDERARSARIQAEHIRAKYGWMSALLSDVIEFDNRARNNNGQFVGSDSEGIDPHSMAAAYNPAAVEKKPSHLASLAGGALGGAAVTTAGLNIGKIKRALGKLHR